MSADLNEKSWLELCDEDLASDKPVLNHQTYGKKEVKEEKLPCSNVSHSDASSAMDDSISEVPNTESMDLKENHCETVSQNVREELAERLVEKPDENILSRFIKAEKDVPMEEIKQEEEQIISKLIKIEKDDQSRPDESKGSHNDDPDDMYLFIQQPVKSEDKDSKLQNTKVKTELKTELNELEIEGAEDEWSTMIEPQEDKSTSKRPTFAQICAKNASPAPVAPACVDNSNSQVSPTKKQRKRSLFPDNADSKKEVFGILDENSVDSPCKDIRKIMTNIHMDSPLRNDSENIEKVSQRKIAVAKRSNLMDSLDSSNSSNLRKRCRDPSKSSDSPASKMPHYSDSPKASKASKESKDGKDSPAKKSKAYETDKATLSRRQKQIDYGKNTKGYDNYIKMVPKEKREAHHPKTPPKHIMYSRRAWDGLIKVWRQKLHFWDLPSEGGQGGIGLPDSWDSLSETSLSVSNSDEMSDKSVPTTPQADRKRVRQGSTISLDSASNNGD